MGVVNSRLPGLAAASPATSEKFTAISRSPRRSVKHPASSSAVGGERGERRVGELGQRPAQRRELPVDVEEDGMPPAASSDQSSFDRSNVAGSCGSGTTDGSQPIRANSSIRPSAVARAEIRLRVRGEELERRRRRPLLAHEQHRRERAAQGQQRGAGQLVVVEVLGQPVAAGAVADLVVVLAADDEPPGRQVRRCRRARRGRVRGTTTTCRRGRSRARTPWPAPTAARSRRSSRRSRRSARRAARGGSRRSTGRRARSRPPSRGVTSRVSLRSDSAISVSGRPRWADRAAVSIAISSRMCTGDESDQRVHGVEPQRVDVVVGEPHVRRCRG